MAHLSECAVLWLTGFDVVRKAAELMRQPRSLCVDAVIGFDMTPDAPPGAVGLGPARLLELLAYSREPGKVRAVCGGVLGEANILERPAVPEVRSLHLMGHPDRVSAFYSCLRSKLGQSPKESG